MTKIDHRIHYYIVLDTETAPIKQMEDVNPYNMLVYDIGWAVVDKRGNVYKTRSFVNRNIFCYERARMQSAHYANKLPQYSIDIRNGLRTMASWYEIRVALREDLAEYGVNQVVAHNAHFDETALNRTEEWLTDGKYHFFFPKDVTICDTMKMAHDVVLPMPTYRKYCETNGFMTKNRPPRARLTAEVLYRFISKDTDFIESHTALEDVLIEKEILRYCLAKHKKMRMNLHD